MGLFKKIGKGFKKAGRKIGKSVKKVRKIGKSVAGVTGKIKGIANKFDKMTGGIAGDVLRSNPYGRAALAGFAAVDTAANLAAGNKGAWKMLGKSALSQVGGSKFKKASRLYKRGKSLHSKYKKGKKLYKAGRRGIKAAKKGDVLGAARAARDAKRAY